ncbi:MAG: hypothetical protein Q4D02_05710 [Clostridia bacterium]|nr:hypothetical protein [Clostridia bacterium]
MAKFTNEKKLKEIAVRYETGKVDELIYFLDGHPKLLEKLSFSNIQKLISCNLHLSPRLYELNYIEQLDFPKEIVTDVFTFRAKFLENAMFFDEFLEFYDSLEDAKRAILNMTKAFKGIKSFPNEISLYSLVKIGSICPASELNLIILGLNKYTRGNSFYKTFNTYIEKSSVSAATATHLLESYIEDCYNSSDPELLVPEKYIHYYIHH